MLEIPDDPGRRGVVAIIPRAGRLLVIRRSRRVVAPRVYCFPGGGIEGDETDEQALLRELREELGVAIRPRRRLWQCVTPWKVQLSWWLAELPASAVPVPNTAEVESVHWLTVEEMAALPDLLESNRRFLELVQRGEIRLDRTRGMSGYGWHLTLGPRQRLALGIRRCLIARPERHRSSLPDRPWGAARPACSRQRRERDGRRLRQGLRLNASWIGAGGGRAREVAPVEDLRIERINRLEDLQARAVLHAAFGLARFFCHLAGGRWAGKPLGRGYATCIQRGGRAGQRRRSRLCELVVDRGNKQRGPGIALRGCCGGIGRGVRQLARGWRHFGHALRYVSRGLRHLRGRHGEPSHPGGQHPVLGCVGRCNALLICSAGRAAQIAVCRARGA